MPQPPYVAAPSSPMAGPAASLVLKTGQTSAFQLSGYNSNAATRYLLVFDAAALPANGTAPLLPPVQVPTKSTAGYDFGMYGRPFVNGIVLALSTTDTTLTIAGTDGIFDGTTYP